MHRSARRLGAATALALVAGLATLSPASAAEAGCGPAPVANNNNAANQAPVGEDDTAEAVGGTTVEIPVLANDTDPDGDTLVLVTAGRPDKGTACTTVRNTIRYTGVVSEEGYTTTFTYGFSDGDRYRTASVTIDVAGVKGATTAVQQKLVVKRGKVTRAAKVAITNPNDFDLELAYGGRRSYFERTLKAGTTLVVTTREKQFQVLSFLGDEESEQYIVNASLVNTRTGKVETEYVGDYDEYYRVADTGRTVARYVR